MLSWGRSPHDTATADYLFLAFAAASPLTHPRRICLRNIDTVLLTRGERFDAARSTRDGRRVLTVTLADPILSRLHLEILREGESYRLADQGSRNGTRRNGRRIVQTAVDDGDLIEAGQWTLVSCPTGWCRSEQRGG